MGYPFQYKKDEFATGDNKRSAFTKSYLIPVGSILVAALGLVAQNAPAWVTYAAVSYLLFVVVFALYPIGRMLLGIWFSRRAVLAAINANMLAVMKVIDKLPPHLSQSRTGAIFDVWQSVSAEEAVRGLFYADSSHLDTLNTWFRLIREYVNVAKGDNRIRRIKELSSLIMQYAKLCEQAYRDIESALNAGIIDDKKASKIRQEWNHARDSHNRLIEDWTDICTEVNRLSGNELLSTYFPTLKPF